MTEAAAAIDYEKEYNNRGRVPEHPEIFERWEREGAAYRAGARDAELGVAYGPSPRQTIDIFPAKDDDASTAARAVHSRRLVALA